MNTDFFTKRIPSTWAQWAKGLYGGVMGGVANTVTVWLTMVGANSLGIDVPKLNWKALGMICVISALSHAASYLAKSPLPDVPADSVTPP